MMDNKKIHQLIQNKAVQLLAQRNHSAYELKQKLKIYIYKKITQNIEDKSDLTINDLPQDITDQINLTVTECEQKNWLNDADYVEQYINMRANKGYAKQRIIYELTQRGLSLDLIQAKLNQMDVDWINIGVKQFNKKFTVDQLTQIKSKAKIFRYFNQKGFEHHEVVQIISAILL